MPGENNVMEAAAMTVGGAGMASLVFFTLRHFVLKVSRDVTTVQYDMTQRELISGMREEVTRLEAVLDKTQKTIDSHTAKIALLERQVMDYRGSAMVALALVEAFQCNCATNNGLREKLIAVLHRMTRAEDFTG